MRKSQQQPKHEINWDFLISFGGVLICYAASFVAASVTANNEGSAAIYLGVAAFLSPVLGGLIYALVPEKFMPQDLASVCMLLLVCAICSIPAMCFTLIGLLSPKLGTFVCIGLATIAFAQCWYVNLSTE